MKISKIAKDLAEMASDEDYRYEPTGESQKLGKRRWWKMKAFRVLTGEEFEYWLARDDGSYRGSSLDGSPLQSWLPRP